MPIYDDLIDKLEETLEECSKDKIKAADIEGINKIVDAVYKLHKINMLEDVEHGNYGDDNYGDYWEEQPNHYGSYNRRYDNQYGYTRRPRDSRGRYTSRKYGHDHQMIIKGLEEKMPSLSGQEQDILRRAINIIETR